MELSQIAEAIDTGDDIGGEVHIVCVETLPADKVRDELLAVGNDGSLFERVNDDNDDEHEPPRSV
jgi:hypothetical protein